MAARSRSSEVNDRRQFLARTVGGALAAPLASSLVRASAPALEVVEPSPSSHTRSWLGPHFWGNRLQDFRLHEGQIECLRCGPDRELRTVALLTREMVPGDRGAHLSLRARLLEDAGGGGFCGFLVGAGAGLLDWQAAALTQQASGMNGGLLCTYGSDGLLCFREHTDERAPTAYARLPAEVVRAPGPALREFRLEVEITPESRGRFTLTLSVWSEQDELTARVRRKGVRDHELCGGILLVSSHTPGKAGARYALWDASTAGPKVQKRDERALGPILGALHSCNGDVLKLSAQLMPIGEGESQTVRLRHRRVGAPAWQEVKAALMPGFVATFRVAKWDSTCDHEYQLVHDSAAQPYQGIIKRDPGTARPLRVGLLGCTAAVARNLDGGAGQRRKPETKVLGRYTPDNFLFPYSTLVKNVATHQPDLLVFSGDQLYEGNPTEPDPDPHPLLDYLYKWYLWVWSFRALTRDTPAILQVDDHDVYHGNLWGNGGRLAPHREQNRGGFKKDIDFVNTVQRTQCAHNPDPFDARPLASGVTVYYGRFRIGGVEFAVLEDRKWKTSPIQGEDLDVHTAALLGERQHTFLARWGEHAPAGAPRVCLTQTLFGCLQTGPEGEPLVDWDANGYPKPGRDRALALLRAAGALIVSGDQHMGSLVRHGLDRPGDGPLQFTVPAGGAGWQRWFEPKSPLPGAKGRHTGDFVDGFGNHLRVLAVANPKVSFAEYRKHRQGRSQNLGQRTLKSEGYGLLVVDHQRRQFRFECWPWDADPRQPGARQFAGWPQDVAFDRVGRES